MVILKAQIFIQSSIGRTKNTSKDYKKYLIKTKRGTNTSQHLADFLLKLTKKCTKDLTKSLRGWKSRVTDTWQILSEKN